jgi:adenylate cyclase
MRRPLPGDIASEPEVAPRATQLKRTLFAILLLAAVACLCAPLFGDRIDRTPPGPVNGVMDLTGRTPGELPISLAGQWRLYWLAPGPRSGPLAAPTPGQWLGVARPTGGTLPRHGRARYELTVMGLAPGSYILFVPTIFAASQVSINAHVASVSGVVGDDRATTASRWGSHLVNVETNGEPLRIAIDVASFHQRDNGLETSPVFGSAPSVRRWLALQWARDLVLSATLLVLGVYSLVIYLVRPADRPSLFFGLSCLCYLPPISMIGPENLFLLAVPDLSFRTMLTIGYLSSILAVGVFVAYVDALFPHESRRFIRRALLAAFVLSFAWQAFALVVLGDTLLASSTYPLTTLATGAALLNTVAVVASATLRGRSGAAVFLLGIALLCVAFAVDAGRMNGLLNAEQLRGASLVPLAILFLLFCHATVLAERWADAITRTEEINRDLRRLMDVSASVSSEMRLEQLLDRIVGATSALVNAERSSVFLHDPASGELWSIVAEGAGAREIRFDATAGLAGAAFTTGRTLSIADAYEDARFNPAIDALTGYRTQSVLSMPLTARDGRRLGVMQALNRRDGRPFSQADAARMAALASQAAIAVENATLFSEVLEAKAYNDSILGSMSNGVVTFDPTGAVASANPAAVRILDLSTSDVAGRAAHEILPENGALLAEAVNVGVTGERRSILEIDLHTASGKAVAANVSLIPLIREEPGEGGDGVLMLIDDISDEKRLESTMRRFMTQSVVDQVLQSQDLLFGSACRSTVLFADIRNFTSIAEQMSPRATVDMLNEIFADIVDVVNGKDGVVDKFMGDAVMAVFGAPIPGGRDAVNAVESATAMLQTAAARNAQRLARNDAPLRLGVGVATGEVIAGTIGSPKRMDYTVIGDRVNLAARLQTLTKHYQVGIAVCETTALAAMAAGHRVRLLDRIRVRGRDQPERVYEVLVQEGDLDDAGLDAMLSAYEAGLTALAARDWRTAKDAFNAALSARPGDRPCEIMRARAEACLADPPDPSWDGIWPTPDAPASATPPATGFDAPVSVTPVAGGLGADTSRGGAQDGPGARRRAKPKRGPA